MLEAATAQQQPPLFASSYRVKDERQENVQLPPSAVEHMQALIQRSSVGGDSRVMDVGSGTGILLRFLQGAGVKQVNPRKLVAGQQPQ